METNYLEINRQSWNNRTDVHIQSAFYDLDSFLKGQNSLNDIELALLGDIAGKDILHLQCHFGQDSISLSRLGANVTGIDLSAEAFPHMAIREGAICGIPTRLFRVSFTGELGFEINVPTAYGRALWERLMAEGAAHGITPYGTETMHVLRAEKGFIIVGQDTDGTVTPYDAGLDWAVGKKKLDFVGRRSLARPDIVAPGRKQLVGLLTDDPNIVLEEGAQIVADPNQPIPMRMIGHVTSSYWSATLGRSIAMALVAGGQDKMGETLHIPMPDKTHTAKVSNMVFYDPEGARLHV